MIPPKIENRPGGAGSLGERGSRSVDILICQPKANQLIIRKFQSALSRCHHKRYHFMGLKTNEIYSRNR